MKQSNRLIKKYIISFITLVLIGGGALNAQSLPDSAIAKINAAFTTVDSANMPGAVIGIVRNDSLLFARGYGLANLECDVPNTPETIFQMASISKQFTGYAVMLLKQQGKLDLDDDIRQYLSLPYLKEKVTISNLLYHTSGLREINQLFSISGTRMEDIMTREHVLKVLQNQRTLNFQPGERFQYTNSNYFLLSEIVQKVSGQSFKLFMDSTIFRPLGMTATYFEDEYTDIIKNRASSYDRKNGVFKNNITDMAYVGSANLFSNVNDYAKWVSNLLSPKVGNGKTVQMLTEPGKLNNGYVLNYGAGIQIDTYHYRGLSLRQLSHAGSVGAYRLWISILPDVKIGVFAFSNRSDFGTGSPVNIAENLLLKGSELPTKLVKVDSSAAILINSQPFKKYIGEYRSDEGDPMKVKIINGKLYYRFERKFEKFALNALVETGKDRFTAFHDSTVNFSFKMGPGDTTIVMTLPDEVVVFTKQYTSQSPSDAFLKRYTGTYYSSELECIYHIVLRDHQLFLTNNKFDDSPITLVGTRHLLTNHWWVGHLFVIEDSSHQVTGFEISCERIQHLKFNKMSQL